MSSNGSVGPKTVPASYDSGPTVVPSSKCLWSLSFQTNETDHGLNLAKVRRKGEKDQVRYRYRNDCPLWLKEFSKGLQIDSVITASNASIEAVMSEGESIRNAALNLAKSQKHSHVSVQEIESGREGTQGATGTGSSPETWRLIVQENEVGG